MSRVIDIADAIKDRLAAQAALATVEIVVDRQKDLVAKLQKLVGKTKGTLITILWEGFVVPDIQASGPRIVSRYVVRAWSRPVISDDVPADVLVTTLVKALHHWQPEAGVHNFGEMFVTDGDFVPDDKHLIYEVSVECALTL